MIRPGDWVVVVRCCSCNPYDEDLGLTFKCSGIDAAPLGLACSQCGKGYPELKARVPHPRIEGFIPYAFLKRIDAPGTGETRAAYIGIGPHVATRKEKA